MNKYQRQASKLAKMKIGKDIPFKKYKRIYMDLFRISKMDITEVLEFKEHVRSVNNCE
jgi:hypothetical protein